MFISVIVNFIPIITAIILHEIAHGYAALLLGDSTAKDKKRLSFNPIRHTDYFGTLILPTMLILSKIGFVFGWAKPVPVNFNNLHNPRRDTVIVASAGIIANICLALISALLLNLSHFISHPYTQGIIGLFLLNMIAFNIILAVFNAIPIPPLDGSKILFGWINRPWAIKYVNSAKWGMVAIIVFAFIIPSIGTYFGFNINIFGALLINISKYFISLLI